MSISSIPIQPVITQAGLVAAQNAQSTGIAVAITHVAFGTAKYAPTSARTALDAEVLRVAISGGAQITPTQLQVYCELIASAGNSFWCGEIGFFAGSVLFAVHSTPAAPVMYISDQISTTASYAIGLSALPSGSVTVTIDGTLSDATALVGLHEGKVDPHPQYIKKIGDTMDGALNEARGSDIASADSINLTIATGNLVDVTGTANITAITLADGAERTVRFTGVLTLTNGANLVLPSGGNITTAAGDFAVFRGYDGGVVRCVTYSRINGQAIVSAESFAGGTLSTTLTLAGDPVLPLQAATKQYVDNFVVGLDPKGSVRAATTANIVLSGTPTIDGIAIIAGDRVLVKNQSTTSQNGVYIVAAGAWSRASDADTWNELVSAYLFVETGTVNADTAWVCSVDSGGILGSTAVSFVQFVGGLLSTSGGTMTGVLNEARGADVASAGSINLTAATGNVVDVTGTTAITAIALADGAERTVRFTGVLTLTNGANLILPSGANITTAAGDFAVFRGYAAGVVRCTSYQRANGQPLASSGLANFTEALDSSAPNSTVKVSSLKANNASADVDFAITPKGAGAILATVPNNAASGGNKRGTSAVDFQIARGAAANVASGAGSVISGGGSNAALGQYSVASGGYQNNAGGNNAVCGGGQENLADGGWSVIAGGFGGNTRGVLGANAYAGYGYSGYPGRQQTIQYILRGETPSNTPIRLTANGGGSAPENNIPHLPASKYACYCRIRVLARDTTGAAKSWTGNALVTYNGGTIAIVGSPTFASDFSSAGLASASVALSASVDGTASLVITATGVAGVYIFWVAHVEVLETLQ